MEQVRIYCPVCRGELEQPEHLPEKWDHPLDGYRIDCEHCGLNAWVEDVSVKQRENIHLQRLAHFQHVRDWADKLPPDIARFIAASLILQLEEKVREEGKQ
ncbi:hypothetical protein K7T73_12495 [Bacillus badius]|uniref:hypothetical protein n=1 Tax=Bacillus badius TaxID=1455 RepID=UPI001CBFFD21|nr:hypothetical protein [Bacillus badius]UAT29420.1 hypothetical protein K7T73_12495 [Bacillus badius]